MVARSGLADTTHGAVLTSEFALNKAREKVTERKVSEIERKVAAERRVYLLEKKRHEIVLCKQLLQIG